MIKMRTLLFVLGFWLLINPIFTLNHASNDSEEIRNLRNKQKQGFNEVQASQFVMPLVITGLTIGVVVILCVARKAARKENFAAKVYETGRIARDLAKMLEDDR
jgi:hypothetical protein